jgi:methionyl-tRNA synthetase
VNRDLADVLGNFVNRILKFTEGKFDGVIPEGGTPGPLEEKLYADVSARLADLAEQMDAIEVRKSAQALRALWVVGNEYLQEAAPWTAIKTDRDRAAVIVRTALNLAALYARISAPFIPFAAEKIAEAFQLACPPAWPTTDAAAELSSLPVGLPVRAPEVLFKKIEDEQIADWTARFGGAE